MVASNATANFFAPYLPSRNTMSSDSLRAQSSLSSESLSEPALP
eukprot:COSAG02_NODE_964_length_15595_cov_7.284709_8_plen_44_part_00